MIFYIFARTALLRKKNLSQKKVKVNKQMFYDQTIIYHYLYFFLVNNTTSQTLVKQMLNLGLTKKNP